MSAKPIVWRVEEKPLSWFKGWERNPRKFTEKGLADLEESLARFGVAEPIVANTDGTVIGGHGRLHVLRSRGAATAQAMLPNRKLSEREVEELNIRLNANIAGVWDFDKLANEFDAVDLEEWGLDVPGVDLQQAPASEREDRPAKVCPHCGGEL